MSFGNRQVLGEIWTLLEPYRGRFLLGTLIRLSSDLVWLFPAWGISQIIDFAVVHETGDPITFFWQMTALIIVIGIYHPLAQDLAKYIIYPIAERIALDAKYKSLKHLFQLDSGWHERENTGNKIKRIASAGDALNQLVRMYVDLIIESTVNVIGITLVLSSLGPFFTGVLILFFISYFYLSVRLTKRASAQSRMVHSEEENLEGISFEAVNNIATVKALNLAEALLKRIKVHMETLNEAIRKRVFLYRTRTGFLNLYREFFRQFMLILVALQIFSGQVEVGILTLVLQYFVKISSSSEELADVAHEFIQAKIRIGRMREILDEVPTAEHSGTKVFPKKWAQLRLSKVHFAYQGRKVLKDFSLSLNRGEKLGIVGLSGAGKSTLFKLLLKLYDDYEGHITFDQTELREVKRSTYIPSLAYVPQETELFNLSLKENISLSDYGKPLSQSKLKRALDIAHVKDFLDKLPQGVDSLVGEKGVKLSGGEKQRVGIARAIYKDPELLLLDEATSHLDADSERKIQAALHHIFKNMTAVVIAHRLSTLKQMDRIVVMSRGAIVEEGSFEALKNSAGLFAELLEKQRF